MSPKQWFSLLGFYISYLFFGASVFYYMEQRLETERRSEALEARIEINELLKKYTAPHDPEVQQNIFDKLYDYCEKPVSNHTEDKYLDPYVWNFYHAFFFSFTVCSTVGYGNISPNNTTGRMFMIFYALIGIPVSGILFAYLGEFFGQTFIGLYRKYKDYKLSTNKNYVPKRLSLLAQIVLYLAPGMLIFIFLPACLFTYFEDWPYSISVYYAFVTLTTIGFGDYVVTFQPHQEREFGVYFVMYQIFVILWVIFGLGYLLMITGFIGRGLRSKKVARIEHQLSMGIKQTQSRIWNNVTRDVGYLRKILNEINMLKFKPVYHEDGDLSVSNLPPRSESCPDLTMYRKGTFIPRRKRAFSVGYDKDELPYSLSQLTLNRIQSDSDLSRIDRKKTFEGANAMAQPGELLARVVTALGYMRPHDEDSQSVLEMGMSRRGSMRMNGVQGFTDSQILASERKGSGWSLPSTERSFGSKKPRDRALSDFRIPPQHPDASTDEDHNEWTWSGSNTQMKELMKLRQKQSRKEQDLYRKSFGADKFDNYQTTINIPPTELSNVTSATNNTLLSRLNPFKKRPSLDITSQAYLDATARGRQSKISLSRGYEGGMRDHRPSIFSLSPQTEESDQALLESTTIADLIRALEIVHTNAENANAEANELSFRHRKMGTASLTPPKMPSLLTLFPQNFEPTAPGNAHERRRGSLRPPNVYGSARMAKRLSLVPRLTDQPPPYTPSPIETPKVLRRRFSVRPSNLFIPPGQAPSIGQAVTPSSSLAVPSFSQGQSALQRKLSLRPSPFTRLSEGQSSARNVFPRAQQLQREAVMGARARHGSLSNLYERSPEQSENISEAEKPLKSEKSLQTDETDSSHL